MATTPFVDVPPEAWADGRISMSAVVHHHAPELSGPRQAFFDALTEASADDVQVHELQRLGAAEVTGCRLCRNVRFSRATQEVDEDAVQAVRRGDLDGFEEDVRTSLRLAARFLARPSEAPGCAEEVAALGADRVAAQVMGLAKAVAFGKVLVALGVEPEAMPVTVV